MRLRRRQARSVGWLAVFVLGLFASRTAHAQDQVFPFASDSSLFEVLQETLDGGGTLEALRAACLAAGCGLERTFYFSSENESVVRVWLRSKRTQLPFFRFAATTAAGRSHAVVVVRGADITSLANPSASPASQRLLLRIDAGLADPILYTMNEHGDVQTRVLDRSEYDQGTTRTRRTLEVSLEVVRVQVVAHSRLGVVPIVTHELRPRIERDTVNAARPLTAILNLRRAARPSRSVQGPVDLRENTLLQELASTRASATCQSNQLVHQTRVGTPDAFLLRHGLSSRFVGEALAIDDSEEAAWQSLLESPSHRFALLQHRFTDIGVDVVHEGERVCVAVLLAERPRAVPAR